MRVVGEVIKNDILALDPKKKIPLIGITNWSTITNNHLLINVIFLILTLFS